MTLTDRLRVWLAEGSDWLAQGEALADEVAALEAGSVPEPAPVPPAPSPPEPAPAPEPPAPPPAGDEPPAAPPIADPAPLSADALRRLHYRLYDNRGPSNGSDALWFNRAVALRWRNLNGDWLDRNGVQQGAEPWYVVTVPLGYVGPVQIDITELARRWHAGENRGAMFQVPDSTPLGARVMWSGAAGAVPPVLRVTTAAGAVHDLSVTLCGFVRTTASAPNPPTTTKTHIEARTSTQWRNLLHAPDLFDVPDVASAELVMHGNSNGNADMVFHVFETDAPRIKMGGDGLPAEPGLLAEVGWDALKDHPDVVIAGDFRESNWNATPGRWPGDFNLSRLSRPARLINTCKMHSHTYRKTTVHEDPEHPGRRFMRTCVPAGEIAGGTWHHWIHKVGSAESGYMPDPDTLHEELYVSCEVLIEADSFWSHLYAFKFGMSGMTMQYGIGDPVDGWNWLGGSTHAWGNGQTPGDGKRFWDDDEHQRWGFKGHSIRMHTLGWPHPTETPTPGALALGIAPSHLGPYDRINDGGVYGSEQNMRIGDHCIPMNRRVRIESYCKVNSIDLSVVDEFGNGTPRNDGIWRMWMDGVMVGERTNLAWRCHPAYGIAGTYGLIYHGGGSPANHDIWFRVYDLIVARRYIGCEV